ncbi:unnamed protein product [Effrenium voratum]|nr:unnamed protein product [Effrenium voratum]
MESGLWRRRCLAKTQLTVLTDDARNAEHGLLPAENPLTTAYELDKILGRGSVGFVYRARRRADQREVAVKIRHVPEAAVIQSCQQEFEVLKKLEHPHIIKVIDFVVLEGQAALIFDFCCEGTLRSVLKQSWAAGLPVASLKPLSQKLLDAVNYLHRRRIVHRDIKPENILLQDDLQNLWLADFNTACQLMSGWSLTMTGTLDYAAPEVLQGESPSEKSDIWGLGLSLHFMAVGKLPRKLGHYADLASFAAAVASKEVNLQTQEWQEVPLGYCDIVAQCLRLDKTLRPASMLLLESPWFRDHSLKRAVSETS